MAVYRVHRRLEALNVEWTYEEYQCQQDPRRDKRRLREIKREMAALEKRLNDFYNDPMTACCGF